jgi:hypothetical protein
MTAAGEKPMNITPTQAKVPAQGDRCPQCDLIFGLTNLYCPGCGWRADGRTSLMPNKHKSPGEIDWADAGRTFSKITTSMMHDEHTGLYGDEFYAEALRRLWARIGHQFVAQAEHMRILEMNRSVDRANGEQAQQALAHYTAEYERKMRESARVYAEALRARCNERTVPSRYRRDGVLLAAAWLHEEAGP